jgi:subtilisin family serine protease
MPENHGSFSDETEPLRDDRFPDLTAGADAALRLVAWLIVNKDFRQLEQRTGIPEPRPETGKRGNFRLGLGRRFMALLRRFRDGLFGARQAEAKHFLPVLLQLDAARGKPELFSKRVIDRYGIPLAYQAELERNRQLTHITGHVPLGPEIFEGSAERLVSAVSELRSFGVGRVCLGVPGQPSRERDLLDIGLPHNRDYKTKVLTGDGVIVGIIDDGCALAHRDFLKKTLPGALVESRILCLWDQGGTAATSPPGWQALTDFPYGRELKRTQIETTLNANRHGDLVCEDAVYQQLGYPIGEVETHGTHVMDIAAGTGQSVMGIEGVAPGADIIFVQLPLPAIEEGATALWRHIKDGAAYIFARAEAAGKPAVVNISYGGYDGPHDGSSPLEKALDELLAQPNRAVVIAAGNGFEADCHATRNVPKNGTRSLRWIVKPEDPTANDLEIWYDATSTLAVRLRPPRGAVNPAGWVQLGQARTPIKRGGKDIGYIEHLQSDTGNGGNRILISLNATDQEATTATTAPAPAGLWQVDLKHVSGPNAAVVHAWIWRDDAGRSRNARLRQSRFHPDDAHPAHTIAGWATGNRTISVGAYNLATNEICRYSAAGPTRPTGGNPGRAKPEIYAPAEEDVRGYGVLSASALSANPDRMNGTSAAAPLVTGLIALMFEYARKHSTPPVSLTADQIRNALAASFGARPFDLNRHQAVDRWVIIKQSAVLADLVPTGRTDFTATMNGLPL